MNETQLKNELESCLTWAEYANDFNSFEYYDAKINPLESEYFSVSQITALYHYVCHKNITLDDLYCYDTCQMIDGLSLVWLDMDLSIGENLLQVTSDLLDTLELWYSANCTKL
jgi:hypothetical protein